MTVSSDKANDEWASTRINALAESLDIPDRPTNVGRLTEYSPQPSDTRTRLTLVAAGLVLIVLVGIVALMTAGHQSAKAVNTVSDDQSGATTTSELSFEEQAANLTKPLYPEDLRQPLYQAHQALSDCMHANGADGFPTPNPSFGDGNTPAMIVDQPTGGTPEGDTWEAAWATCKPQQDAVVQVSDEIRRRGTPDSGCQQPSDSDVLAKVSQANAVAKDVLPASGLAYSSVGGTWATSTCSVQIMVYGVSEADRTAVEGSLEARLGSGFTVAATSALITPLAQTGH